MVKGDTLNANISQPFNEFGGDPASGRGKTLVIEYRFRGQNKSLTLNEAYPVAFAVRLPEQGTIRPDNTSPTVSFPDGERQPVTTAKLNATQQSNSQLTVVKAVYGAEQSWVDVTAKVASLISDDTLSVQSDTSLAGSDPIFGTVKELRLTYRFGMKETTVSVREGDSVVLPTESDRLRAEKEILPVSKPSQPISTLKGNLSSERIKQKLNEIVLPEIRFRDAALLDVADFLSKTSKHYDREEIGVSIVLDTELQQAERDKQDTALSALSPALPLPTAGTAITLDLENAWLADVLNHVTRMAGLKYYVKSGAVVITKTIPEGVQKEGQSANAIATNECIRKKSDEIIFPEVRFREAMVTDVVVFLTSESRRFDREQTGVHCVLDGTPKQKEQLPLVTLNLNNVSLSNVLYHVTRLAALSCWIESGAVVLTPEITRRNEAVTTVGTSLAPTVITEKPISIPPVPAPTITFSFNAFGCAWPKEDTKITDNDNTPFSCPPLGSPCETLSRTDKGYLIVAKDTKGRKRPAILPFSDRMGNATVASGAIINNLGVELRPGYLSLRKGQMYPVISQTETNYTILYKGGDLSQTAEVARADVDFMSASDYEKAVLDILGTLKAAAEPMINQGDYKGIVKPFREYQGKYAAETVSERWKWAREFEALAFKQYEATQQAKGFVKYNNRWLAPEEAKRQHAVAVEQWNKQQEEKRVLAVLNAVEASAVRVRARVIQALPDGVLAEATIVKVVTNIVREVHAEPDKVLQCGFEGQLAPRTQLVTPGRRWTTEKTDIQTIGQRTFDVAYIRGLTSLHDGEYWTGQVYPDGEYEYTTVQGAYKRVPKYSVEPSAGLVKEVAAGMGVGNESSTPVAQPTPRPQPATVAQNTSVIGNWQLYQPDGSLGCENQYYATLHPDGRFEVIGQPDWSGNYRHVNATTIKRTCKNGEEFTIQYNAVTGRLMQNDGYTYRRVR
jgi:hypothetical protein